MYLYPKNVRNSAALGSIDIAIRRPSIEEGSTEAQLLYIEDGIAHVAGTKYPNTAVSTWIQLYTVGPAIDVAIEFDMEWAESYGKFRPITLGEPWLFRASGGKLLAQKGESKTPLILDEGNVSVVDAARGWYNLIRPWEDHGLVVAYIKNGEVWVRQYCRQELGTKIWEEPYKLEGFTDIVDVSVYRTNDYRIAFILTNSGGGIYNVVSSRNWAGAGNSNEYVATGIGSMSVNLTAVKYHTIDNKAEVTSIGVPSITAVLGYTKVDNTILSLSNDGQTSVIATINNPYSELDYKDFVATDTHGRTSYCSSVDQKVISGAITLSMTFVNFNNLVGEVTVAYTGKGSSVNGSGVPFSPFTNSFVPVGLIPTPPPNLVSIANVGDENYE